MELEKFEEVYQVLEAQKEKDETAAELYADVKEFAYKYATMRYRFSEMSREEKVILPATIFSALSVNRHREKPVPPKTAHPLDKTEKVC